MESGNSATARTASYSKLNDWNQANTKPPLTSRRSTLSRWKCVFVGLIIVSCLIFIGCGIGFGLSKIHRKEMFMTKDEPFVLTFPQAAVSSQSAVCSEIGRDIMLNKNGSVVDAAIAALICEGAYSPQSAGLGGGFFMIVYRKDDNLVETIDARETAPLKADKFMFRQDVGAALKGGLAVAVPGELRGYQLAHERHGRVKWADLFRPTIDLCRQGITISKYLASVFGEKSRWQEILEAPTLRSTYVDKQTEKALKGDVILSELANTLEAIAINGADEFYTGNISKKLLADLKALGSIINETDLADYKALLRKPARYQLKGGVDFYSMPPPGSGHLLGLLLKVLDSFDYYSTSAMGDADNVTFHQRFIEACKFVYAKRPEIGDPDYETEVQNLIALLTAEDLALKITNAINDSQTFDPAHYDALFQPKADHGTAQVVVWGPNGDLVSATSTLNTWFGAKIRSESTGVILNNEMDDFSTPEVDNFYGLPPATVNFITPGKRPASSMCPSLAVSATGEPLYVLGASGGSRIVSVLSYVYAMHIFLNKSLEEAIDFPRLHHQLFPNYIEYEPGFPEAILDELRAKGHEVQQLKWKAAVYFMSRNEKGHIVAGADPRRFGVPAGF